jgi:parallel beta-helix repeat protein
VQDLDLVGRDVSPIIYGDGVTFRGNDVTNNHAGRTCFLVGDAGSRVSGTRIEANIVHDCGRVPATNLDHGIYVANSRSATITLNTFYGNSDWGVHLYPNADGTTVTRNIIDGNGAGVIFGGTSGSERSQNNVVERNLITYPVKQDTIQSYWGGSGKWSGGDSANVARSNCVWGGHTSRGGVNTRYGGYSAQGNVVAEPGYVDRGSHNYHLRPDSACLPVTGDIAAEQSVAPKIGTAARVMISPRRAGKRALRVQGRVVGARPGRIVVQVKRGRHWRRAAVGRVSRRGNFRVTVRAPHRAKIRAVVPGVAASPSVVV